MIATRRMEGKRKMGSAIPARPRYDDVVGEEGERKAPPAGTDGALMYSRQKEGYFLRLRDASTASASKDNVPVAGSGVGTRAVNTGLPWPSRLMVRLPYPPISR